MVSDDTLLSEIFDSSIASKLAKAGIHSVGQLLKAYQYSPHLLRESLSETQYNKVVAWLARHWKPNVVSAKQKRKQTEPTLSTGVISIDYVLGGGIKKGRIAEFFGEYGSGKSHICLTSALHAFLPEGSGGLAQKQNELKVPRILWIDTEGVIEDLLPVAENILKDRIGLNPDVILDYFDILQIPTVDALLATLNWLKSQNYSVVVIDSIAELIKEEFQEPAQMSERARVLKQIVSIIKILAFEHKITFLLTNHVYANIGSWGGPDVQAYGGHVLGHFATYHFRMKNSNARGTKYCDPKKVLTYDVPGSKRNEFVVGTSDWGTVDWEVVVGGKKLKACENLPQFLQMLKSRNRKALEQIYPSDWLV